MASYQIDKSDEVKFNYRDTGIFEVSVNVMASDVFANDFIFSKEVIEKSFKTLINKPLVTEWKPYDDGKYRLGDHGGEHILKSTSETECFDTTFAIGTIPEQKINFIKVANEENTRFDNYLNVKSVLWTEKYPQIVDYIYENGANQSMEILIDEYEYDENDKVIVKDFRFTALCALNKDTNPDYNILPAFELADITPISKMSDNLANKTEYEKQMEEFNAKFEDKTNELLDKIQLLFDNKNVKKDEDILNENFKQDKEGESMAEKANKNEENKENKEKLLADFDIKEIMADERVVAEFEIIKNEIKTDYETKLEKQEVVIGELNTKFANYDELNSKVVEFEKNERMSKFDNMVSDKFSMIPIDSEKFLEIRQTVEEGNNFEDEITLLKLKSLAFDIQSKEDSKENPEEEKVEEKVEEKEEEKVQFSNAGVMNRPKKHNVNKKSEISDAEYNNIFK